MSILTAIGFLARRREVEWMQSRILCFVNRIKSFKYFVAIHTLSINRSYIYSYPYVGWVQRESILNL